MQKQVVECKLSIKALKSVECKKEYSSEEIQTIRSLSRKRTEQKALERQRLKYDADTRSEKHKQSYNSSCGLVHRYVPQIQQVRI